MTVKEAIASSCSTSPLAGLSKQIIAATMHAAPGLLVPIAISRVQPAHGNVHLFLQRSAHTSLMLVSQERPSTILIVNSCFRPLPEQLAVRMWLDDGRCGITEAAEPGAAAPHTLAEALDVQQSDAWRAAFLKHGWTWQGFRDPMHYQHAAGIDRGLAELGVKVTQELLVKNGAHISIDGVFGEQTRQAVLNAPAAGWIP